MTTVPALTDEAALAQYVATGGQTDFNFSYMIFATADIEVYVNGVLKTETTHYTVKKSNGTSISASDLPLDGGKVVFVSGLTADDEVSLNRNIAIARLTGYSVAGAFRADVVNAEFTKALAISQQLRRDVERSVRLAAFDSEGGDLTIPTGRASKLLGFDADGDMALFGGVTEQIVPVSTFMATVLDDADASSALTTLGVSTFIKTLLDDADASSALTTLGVSTFIKTLLDDADASAARTTLGLAIGTNVQAYDADLSTLAALPSIANLTALADLTGAADKIPYFTGAGAMDLTGRGWEKISKTTINNVATVDFTGFEAGYDYMIRLKHYVPATDATELWLRTSANNGSSYDAGASDYAWGRDIVINHTTPSKVPGGDDADSEIMIHDNVGNDNTAESVDVDIILHDPAAVEFTQISTFGQARNPNPQQLTFWGGGVRHSKAAVTAARLLASSGSMVSGTVTLLRMKL